MLLEVLRPFHLSAAPELATLFAEKARGSEPTCWCCTCSATSRSASSRCRSRATPTARRCPCRARWRGARSRPTPSWMSTTITVVACGSLDGTERLWCGGDDLRRRAGSAAAGVDRGLRAFRALDRDRHRQRTSTAITSSCCAATRCRWRASCCVTYSHRRVLAGDEFVLAALIESCYDIGGDTYGLRDQRRRQAPPCRHRRHGARTHSRRRRRVRASGVSEQPSSRRRSCRRPRGHQRRRVRAVPDEPVPDRAERRARRRLRPAALAQRRASPTAAGAWRADGQDPRRRALAAGYAAGDWAADDRRGDPRTGRHGDVLHGRSDRCPPPRRRAVHGGTPGRVHRAPARPRAARQRSA